MVKTTIQRICHRVVAIVAIVVGMVLTAAAQRHHEDGASERQMLCEWRAGEVVSAAAVAAYGVDSCFGAVPISDAVFKRMQGRSFRPNPHISRARLRYVRALHYDAEGRIHIGELVCHERIAADAVAIFRALYEGRYPVERMVLIDNYDADDERSMAANNTSGFCYRTVAGSSKVSAHAIGMAIDINPLYNPYVKTLKDGRQRVRPAAGRVYADRRRTHAYMLRRGDLCHRLFVQHGFVWGGAWRSVKDYQHFEKNK
ncbi:MAG: M15 family metallopeptidase [Prevotella sp.]